MVAQQEVYKVSVFRLSAGDTERDQWEGDGRLGIKSRNTGPISIGAKRIRHLKIYAASMLEGTSFAFIDGKASFTDYFFPERMGDAFDQPQKHFSNLRILDF